MAEIHLEKKNKGLGWLWVLLAILLIALALWLLWPRDREVEPVAGVVTDTDVVTDTATPLPPLPGAGQEASIAAIRANPQQWVGQQFSGTVNVAEVPTDRGFWIEQNGARMFAVIVDEPREVPMHIQQGQRLQITGTVRDAQYLSQLPGEPLTAGTENIIRQEPVYLVADESTIQIQ